MDIYLKMMYNCYITLLITNMAAAYSQGQSINPLYESNNYYAGPSANVSQLLDSILHGYDKRLRPEYKSAQNSTVKGPPIEVEISMHVSSISSISEVDMDFTLDMYFRQYWTDKRLVFTDSHAESDELIISQDMLSKIWWPDTFFANAKKAVFHEATTKNAFLRIKPEGKIVQSLRLTVTASCNMDLTYFPMDSQVCSLEIESYGYSTADIIYKWTEEKKVTLEPNLLLPQFNVANWKTKIKLATTSTGSYSRLSLVFLFERSLGYYIIQIYVPSCMIVVLSWVSFWLHKDAVPARVALGITTVLTMTTFVSNINASLPKLSYLKSIDVYLIVCFFMVFMSLMEFAGVSYMGNKYKEALAAQKDEEKAKEKPLLDMNNDLVSSKQCEKLANHQCHPRQMEVRLNIPHSKDIIDYREVKRLTSGEYVTVTPCQPRLSLDDSVNIKRRRAFNCSFTPSQPDTIDIYARVLFPCGFIIFNILYWAIYLQVSQTTRFEEDNQTDT